jgi:hypothetical protein
MIIQVVEGISPLISTRLFLRNQDYGKEAFLICYMLNLCVFVPGIIVQGRKIMISRPKIKVIICICFLFSISLISILLLNYNERKHARYFPPINTINPEDQSLQYINCFLVFETKKDELILAGNITDSEKFTRGEIPFYRDIDNQSEEIFILNELQELRPYFQDGWKLTEIEGGVFIDKEMPFSLEKTPEPILLGYRYFDQDKGTYQHSYIKENYKLLQKIIIPGQDDNRKSLLNILVSGQDDSIKGNILSLDKAELGYIFRIPHRIIQSYQEGKTIYRLTFSNNVKCIEIEI